MKVWGSIEVPTKIEFISYSPKYYDQVLEVIRKSFFLYETVSIASEIDKNIEGQKDLELLCDDVLKKSGVSIIARDVEKDKIVGVALNVIQVGIINFLSENFTDSLSLLPRSRKIQVTHHLTSRHFATKVVKLKTQNL
jgi:hypothetical protein